MSKSALTDITGGNRINALVTTILTEASDTLRPSLGSAIIDYNNGKMVISATETLDVDNLPTQSNFDVSLVRMQNTVALEDSVGGTPTTTSLAFPSLANAIPAGVLITIRGIAQAVSLVTGTGATPSATTLSFSVGLSEAIPANATITISPVPGETCAIAGTTTADASGAAAAASSVTLANSISLAAPNDECQITWVSPCASAGEVNADGTGASVGATSVGLATSITSSVFGDRC